MIEPLAIRMKAAAAYLGVGIKTVRYWVDEGQLPVIKGPSRHFPWRFDVRDLEELQQKTKQTRH
jgi:excisionase family DNA binding protein